MTQPNCYACSRSPAPGPEHHHGVCDTHAREAVTATGENFWKLFTSISDVRARVWLPFVVNPLTVAGYRSWWSWHQDTPLLSLERAPSKTYFEFRCQHHDAYVAVLQATHRAFAGRAPGDPTIGCRVFQTLKLDPYVISPLLNEYRRNAKAQRLLGGSSAATPTADALRKLCEAIGTLDPKDQDADIEGFVAALLDLSGCLLPTNVA